LAVVRHNQAADNESPYDIMIRIKHRPQQQRSTLSKQHSTLLPKTATMSNECIVKVRPFDKVQCCFDTIAVLATTLNEISSFSQSRNKLNMFNLFRLWRKDEICSEKQFLLQWTMSFAHARIKMISGYSVWVWRWVKIRAFPLTCAVVFTTTWIPTYFTKPIPRSSTSSSQTGTAFTDLCLHHFFSANRFLF